MSDPLPTTNTAETDQENIILCSTGTKETNLNVGSTDSIRGGSVKMANNTCDTAETEDETEDECVDNNVITSVHHFEDFHDEHQEGIKAVRHYAKKLKNRNNLNIKRKVTHAMFGFFFAGLNHIVPRARFIPVMTFVTTATLAMELVRYKRGFKWINDTLNFVLGSTLRKHEMEGKFTGSFYYFFGVLASSYFFDKTAATLGIMQLAIADPTASFFGRKTKHVYWSRIENGFYGLGRNKGVLGFLGGAVCCVPFNYRMLKMAKWSSVGLSIPSNAIILGASFGLGLAGAFADLAVPTPALTLPKKICGVKAPPFHVDDNFVVPIFSAFACTKMFDVLGWSDLRLGPCIFM